MKVLEMSSEGIKVSEGEIEKTKRASKSRNQIYRIVQCFFSKVFTVGINYTAGRMNVSKYWMIALLVTILYRDHWRSIYRFRKQVAMALSLRNAEQSTIVNINPSPCWIYFPDIETCECINMIVRRVWSSVRKYTESLIKAMVEPKINEALSKYKSNPGFTFQEFRFGSIVPRISGIRIYKKYTRQYEIIIVDLRLYYVGDTEIYFNLMSIGGGIKNLEINGWLRIVLKLVVQPYFLLGGVEVFFLEKPKFDYSFTGAMDILSLPGVSGMLHRVIDDQIKINIVLPNKISFSGGIKIRSSDWKFPDPEGIVRIHVMDIKDLKDNRNPGTFDPYVEVSFGAQSAFSDYFESSQNQDWELWADFMVDCTYFDEYIHVLVNERNENILLGKVSIELELTKEKKTIRSWAQLEETNCGMIYLEIYYYNIACEDYSEYSEKLPYVLILFVNKAFNLESPSVVKTPSSVIQLEIDNNVKVSKAVMSQNPVFNEPFLFVMNDPKNSELKLKIYDMNTKVDFGHATLPLQKVLSADFMEIMDEICPLLDAETESSVSLSMKLRTIKI